MNKNQSFLPKILRENKCWRCIFLQTMDTLQLHVSSRYIETSSCVMFRHKKHFGLVRERSRFGLKYPHLVAHSGWKHSDGSVKDPPKFECAKAAGNWQQFAQKHPHLWRKSVWKRSSWSLKTTDIWWHKSLWESVNVWLKNTNVWWHTSSWTLQWVPKKHQRLVAQKNLETQRWVA